LCPDLKNDTYCRYRCGSATLVEWWKYAGKNSTRKGLKEKKTEKVHMVQQEGYGG
jgi:hypothetical protein